VPLERPPTRPTGYNRATVPQSILKKPARNNYILVVFDSCRYDSFVSAGRA